MNHQREVYFDQYCKTCKYSNLKDYEDPCNDCLDNSYSMDSHKPVNYKEKEK